MSISTADFKSFMSLMQSIAELKADIEALRAENKCLRENLDSWKQMAMSNAQGKPAEQS